MPRSMRITALAVSVLAALIVAVALSVCLLVRSGWATGRLEAGLGQVLGMDVQIGQPLQLSLLLAVKITLTDIEASREGQRVATVERVSIRLAPFSLLAGTVRALELHIRRPELSVERFSPGVFNTHALSSQPGDWNELSLQRLRVSNARLHYLDQVSDLELVFENCELHMRDISHAGGAPGHAFATAAARGGLNCASFGQDPVTATGLSLDIRADNGVFALDPVSAAVFGGQTTGWFRADFSSDTPEFRLEASLPDLDLAALMIVLEREQSTTGKMELELDLDAHGATTQHVRRSLSGKISMSSGAFTLDGFDLDDALADYADTQRFNLVDAGALFFGGPVALAATRAYTFSGLLDSGGGSTRIDRLVSEWTVEGGVAQVRDVAFRTSENRLALSGALDIGNSRFEDMLVAVVDPEGCAVVEQQITGPFREPEIEQPGFLTTAAGPVIDLVSRGVREITDADCDVFYDGAIAHP